jgi:hypothetical protein
VGRQDGAEPAESDSGGASGNRTGGCPREGLKVLGAISSTWNPEPSMSAEPIEKPRVQIDPSGVSRVAPADILRSKVGQIEISKAANVAVALKLRKPGSNGTSQG